MDKSNIIVFVLVFAVVAFRLYQKYVKKDANKPSGGSPGVPGKKDTSFPSSSAGDDYEPYSKH